MTRASYFFKPLIDSCQRQINPAPSRGVLDPAGRIFLTLRRQAPRLGLGASSFGRLRLAFCKAERSEPPANRACLAVSTLSKPRPFGLGLMAERRLPSGLPNGLTLFCPLSPAGAGRGIWKRHEINSVINSREVLRSPREFYRAVSHSAEWWDIISNGVNHKFFRYAYSFLVSAIILMAIAVTYMFF